MDLFYWTHTVCNSSDKTLFQWHPNNKRTHIFAVEILQLSNLDPAESWHRQTTPGMAYGPAPGHLTRYQSLHCAVIHAHAQQATENIPLSLTVLKKTTMEDQKEWQIRLGLHGTSKAPIVCPRLNLKFG